MSSSLIPRRGALVLLLATFALSCAGTVASAESPMLDKAVTLRLTTEEGAPAQVPPAGARATVLHFWAPECAPCRATIPAVLAKKRELLAKGADLVLVGVLDEGASVEDARAVLLLWGVQERFVIDRGGAALAQVGAPAVPALAIIDGEAILRWVAPDGVTASDLVNAIP